MKTEFIDVSLLKENPDNPRFIKKDKFEKLVNSINEFPEMLEVRPIVINKDNIVLGGNMRLRACIEAGLKEVPVIRVQDWNEEREAEFIIKDNVSGGEWDWDIIANEWDMKLLDDWGMDVIKHDWDELDYIDEDLEKPALSSKNTIVITIPDVLIDQRNEIEDAVIAFLQQNYSGCEVK